jgi:hypothetical protein
MTRTLARPPIRRFTPRPSVNVLLSTVNPKIGGPPVPIEPPLDPHDVLGATDVPPPQATDVRSAVKTAADATRAAVAVRSATVFMMEIGHHTPRAGRPSERKGNYGRPLLRGRRINERKEAHRVASPGDGRPPTPETERRGRLTLPGEVRTSSAFAIRGALLFGLPNQRGASRSAAKCFPCHTVFTIELLAAIRRSHTTRRLSAFPRCLSARKF